MTALVTPLDRIPPAPNTRIYLRDKLRIRKGCETEFKSGKLNLLSLTHNTCQLVAACALEPFSLDTHTEEPPPLMMHVWQLPEWRTLYDAMYYCSEKPWYYELEESLLRESQELLVDLRVGYGVSPRPRGQDYVYLYQEVSLAPRQSVNKYCLYINRFAAEVRKAGWTWIWSASQITGTPGLLCFLWAAPSMNLIRSVLDRLRTERWYNQDMMEMVSDFAQYYMFPTDTQSWDTEIARKLDETARVNRPRGADLPAPHGGVSPRRQAATR